MKSFMARLSSFLTRRRWWVLAAWVLVLAVSLPFAAKQTENLTGGGFDVPGSDSAQVEAALESGFQATDRGRIAAVLKVDEGATPAQIDAALTRLDEAAASTGKAELSPAAAKQAEADLARNGLAVVPVEAEGATDELVDTAIGMREEVTLGEPVDGVTTYFVGQQAAWAGLQEVTKEDLEKAELTGFPIVALILLIVFGSLAAASLPLALGGFAVLVTGGLIYAISLQMEMSVFVTNMASMIGIGVAVDYSLFILARFREAVRRGVPPDQARAEALSTSGLAVTFSGLAVIISLAGLWMVDNQALRSMALGAMVVVGVAILVAITLLPVLIRFLGHRVEAGGVTWSIISFFRGLGRRCRRRGSTTPGAPTFWDRWTATVMRRPVLSVALAGSVLLILASPVLAMKTGVGALDQFPEGHDVRVGNALAAQASGGSSDSLEVIARFDSGSPADGENAAAVADLSKRLADDPYVTGVAKPVLSGDTAMLEVATRGGAESEKTEDFVLRAREDIAPASAAGQSGEVLVGGEGARLTDVREQINSSLWKIIAFVLAFSFVVLTVMLRSIILPLKAVLMNLLSVGAAYGVLVAIFQWGWIDGFLGFESLGAIDTLTPPLILAVVFGLSMDYEVFLLSRIKERYQVHGDNQRAVAEGLASSAGTITSAALIMASVFAVFALTGVPSIKELGVGNAVAIILDATLVRLVLVPAAMQLFGDWNWWIPRWLDRILPDLDVEGGSGDNAPDGLVRLPQTQGRERDPAAGNA